MLLNDIIVNKFNLNSDIMSETSSDTNGESTFEFLNGKDSKNGSKSETQNVILSSTPESGVKELSSIDLSKTEEQPKEMQTVVPLKVNPTLPTAPIEATINVNLNETSSPSPKPRSDSMGSAFFDWIATNEFINKMAEKAKNSVDSMITTLDPGMKEIIYSGGDINIMVTSDKEAKIWPIRESFQKVFGRATVSGCSAQPLSIAAQPIGFENGLKAAKERIQSLRMNTSAIPQNQVIVSVENFIVDVSSDKWYDIGCLYLDDPVLGINLEVYTQMTPIPNECVNQMRFETPIDYAFKSSGYSVTVGAVMANKLNCPSDGWHQSWTGVSRKDIIYQSALSLAHLYKNRLFR